jgi:DnaJ domain
MTIRIPFYNPKDPTTWAGFHDDDDENDASVTATPLLAVTALLPPPVTAGTVSKRGTPRATDRAAAEARDATEARNRAAAEARDRAAAEARDATEARNRAAAEARDRAAAEARNRAAAEARDRAAAEARDSAEANNRAAAEGRERAAAEARDGAAAEARARAAAEASSDEDERAEAEAKAEDAAALALLGDKHAVASDKVEFWQPLYQIKYNVLGRVPDSESKLNEWRTEVLADKSAELDRLAARPCNTLQTIHNLYRILGLKFGTSTKFVKKQYNKLTIKLHPDKVRGKEECFKTVTATYRLLQDLWFKKYYDEVYPKLDDATRKTEFLVQLLQNIHSKPTTLYS